jgi:hypothetical protein
MFVYYNYLNARKPKLILHWMKITNQLSNERIFGLSKRRYQEFWKKEQKISKKFFMLVKFITVMVTLVLGSVNFFFEFDVNIYIFYFITFLHILNMGYYCHVILTFFYGFTYFYICIMFFFSIKFDFITSKIKRRKGHKPINNKKLNRLIFHSNYTIVELVKANDFFKFFFLNHYLHYLSFCICVSFSLLTVTLLIQLLLYAVVITLYIVLIFASFNFSNYLTTKMEKTTLEFQNIVFYNGVSISNKRKINSINLLLKNDRLSGFTVFDLFKLDTKRGFYVSKL